LYDRRSGHRSTAISLEIADAGKPPTLVLKDVMVEQAQYDIEIRESNRSQVRTEQEEEQSIDLGPVLRTLYRGRKTLIIVTAVTLVFALAISFLIPPGYTSTASFIPPNATGSSGAAALAGQLSQLSGLGAGVLGGAVKSSSDLYAGILKSHSIASDIVQRFDLKRVYKVKKESQAESDLASNSKFEVGTKDPIVTISVADRSPQRAHDLANAYLEELTEKNGQLALTESSQRRLFFGQQLAKEKDNLEDAEVGLKETEEKTGLIAPVGQTAAELQILEQTRAQIAAREVELSALRLSSTGENPDVLRLQSEIDDLQKQLAKEQTGTNDRLSGAIPTSKVPELQLDYVRKEREVKYHELLFEMLAKQYEVARLDEARNAPLVQVLDNASYPDSKSSPPRLLIVIGGLILGCMIGAAWVLVRERLPLIRASLK
jgi:tyrosine-protein kinase Etk/Wzc